MTRSHSLLSPLAAFSHSALPCLLESTATGTATPPTRARLMKPFAPLRRLEQSRAAGPRQGRLLLREDAVFFWTKARS